MISLINADNIEYNGTENCSRMDLYADAASEISGLTHFDSIKLLQGSTIKAIAETEKYIMQSDGTWVLLPPENVLTLPSIYTKTEVDDLIDPIQTAVTSHDSEIMSLSTQQSTQHTQIVNLQSSDTKQNDALVEIIDSGAKNRLTFKIADIKQQNTSGTWSGNTFSHSTGVSFTINDDYSVTVNGTASGANAAFVISPNGRFTIENGNWVLSGSPSGGSTTSYNISIAGTASDLGNSVEFTGCTAQFVRIYVISGTTVNNLVFRPMVCSKAAWQITNKYVPYCPSLQEIYRSLL